MGNYDDIINDHEERLDELDETTVKKSDSVNLASGKFLQGTDASGEIRKIASINTDNNYAFANGTMANNVYIGTADYTNTIHLRSSNVKVYGSLEATASGNALPIVVDTVTATAQTISASGNKTITVDATKDGYLPLCIVGFEMSGSGTGSCAMYRLFINSSLQPSAYVHNFSTSNATCTVKFHILYQKTAASPVSEE